MRRSVDAASAVVAAEIGRRSARELGYTGLAQRTGARTPERLIASVSGLSVPESRAMLAAGEVLGAATSPAGGAEWLAPVATALQTGELSVGATAAIRAGLGQPDGGVAADDLQRAAERVAREASGQTPEKAAQLAREARDALDEAGIADRTAHLRRQRSLRIAKLPDGMTRLTAMLDPENAAIVRDAFDRVTSPRRGGVRFVDPGERARSEQIVGDARSTEQIGLDAFVQMILLAGKVDDGAVFGERGPELRVHVSARDLERGAGRAWIEGHETSVGIDVARRVLCTAGSLPVILDDRGEPMRLGRSQRTHSKAQRIAMAVRDGGCVIPGCDRPPSWCEAHHVEEWGRGGCTDLDNGVLLCRHHHRWLDETGARIQRVADPDPPPTVTFELVTADGVITHLPSKSPLRRVA